MSGGNACALGVVAPDWAAGVALETQQAWIQRGK